MRGDKVYSGKNTCISPTQFLTRAPWTCLRQEKAGVCGFKKNMLIDWTTWWHHRILGQACVISLQFVSLSLFLLLLLKLCSKALLPGSCKYKLAIPLFVKLPIHGHCYYFTKIFRIRNFSRLNCEQWRNRTVSRSVVLSVRFHGILCENCNTVGHPKCLLNFLLSGMTWWTLKLVKRQLQHRHSVLGSECCAVAYI